jgi:hypothetical protein
MPKNVAQVKFVHICVGSEKGRCFPRENSEEVWQHLKEFRRKEGYTNVVIRKLACLGICKEGPCLSVIDENAEETLHRLGAENNVEEAKKLLDSFMDDYVIDISPPK